MTRFTSSRLLTLPFAHRSPLTPPLTVTPFPRPVNIRLKSSFSRSTANTKPSTKDSASPRVGAASIQPPKYCKICGRLISPNHAHFDDRKICSADCACISVGRLDTYLEETFMRFALERGQAGVLASEVQAKVPELRGADRDWWGLEARKWLERRPKVGKAQWRERVRRAGRRVVAFWGAAGDGDVRSVRGFVCVRNGKVVEASFAKGDWAVRVEDGEGAVVERFLKQVKSTGTVVESVEFISKKVEVVDPVKPVEIGVGDDSNGPCNVRDNSEQ